MVARLRRRIHKIRHVRRLYWLRLRIWLAPTEGQRLFLLTAVVGAACGLAAVAFHLLIRLLEINLIDRAMTAPGSTWIAWTIVTPTVGGLICGAFLHYAVPQARGSGIPEVKATFADHGRALRLKDSLGKFGIGALQIGSGASLGREGPTVQICAGIASALGRVARVSPKNVRRLLPVGAAAGVAAAFNAPIAAVTFAIEEIIGDLDKAVLSGVIVAAAIAAVIERSVLGEHPVFDLPRDHGLEHVSSLLVYVLLGAAAGIVAVVFTDSLLGLRERFRQWTTIPAWSKPAVGGAVTGVLAVAAIHWFGAQGVTGGGYHTLEAALGGGMLPRTMLALCLLKLIATVFSYGSGGAGGIFAPALFIGGMLGGSFGLLDARYLGHSEHVVGSFALVGMGAMFAGSIRAPITSVLIIVEMTGGYSLILPLMIANMIAFGVARRLRPTPIYEALLEQDGVHLRPTTGMHVLEGIHLSQVSGTDRGPKTVVFEESTGAREILGARVEQEVYPVVERSTGRMIGIITDEEIVLIASERGLHGLLTAGDVMRAPVVVSSRDDLRTALDMMIANGLRRIPVVDDEMRLTGFVDEAAIARAYLRGNAVGTASRG